MVKGKQSGWIPVKVRKPTAKDRREFGEEVGWIIESDMPEAGQEILITTTSGAVEHDRCVVWSEVYTTEREYDWAEDIVAWMPCPEAYKGGRI